MKKAAKRLVFISILAVVIITGCMSYADRSRIAMSDGFYDFYNNVEDNTIDVLCIGSSHMYCGINPIQMYNDYGIAGYDLAAGSQRVWDSYFYLVEALKTQTPQIVVLDIYTITSDGDNANAAAKSNYLTMKFSLTKFQALKTSGAEDIWDLLFAFPITHTRYDEIGWSNFLDHDDCNLGYHYDSRVAVCQSIEDVTLVDEATPISEKAEEYLRKIIELCQEKRIDIILTNAPTPAVTSEWQEKYNYVEKIADEYGVPFLNGCLYTAEIGMDYEEDCLDASGHLNYSGVTKYTVWLENYLKENYTLADRRKDQGYEHWEEAAVRLAETIRAEKRNSMEKTGDFLSDLIRDKYNYGILIYNGSEDEPEEEVVTALHELGVELTEPCVYVFEGGKISYYAKLEDSYEYTEYREKKTFYLQ